MDVKKNEKVHKRKKKTYRIIQAIILFISIIILVVFAYIILTKEETHKETDLEEKLPTEDVKDVETDNLHILNHQKSETDIGDIESIIEYGTNKLIGVHYPIFEKTNIDNINEKLVRKYIDDFKRIIIENNLSEEDYKYEFSIDYETHAATENIISIVYNISENASYFAHPDTMVITKSFDLSKDSEIKLDDIMDGDYIEKIANISKEYFTNSEDYKDHVSSIMFEEGIAASGKNYSHFVLKEDTIVFIFQKYQLFSGNYGIQSIAIPYEKIKDNIRLELFPIIEKEPDLEEPDLEEPETPREDGEDESDENKRVINPDKPMIAITFDDGPNKATTIPILDTLKKNQSVATFFVLGNRVPKNADIIKRALAEGSEIGNHSYSHKELTKLGNAALKDQIINTQEAIFNTTNIEAKIMRPTYGSHNENIREKIEMPFILWSVDTMDWDSRNAELVKDHVMKNVKDGDIILMHDIYESTAEAVELMVPELIERGYQLVTVSELFEARGEKLDNGELYYKRPKK